MSRRLLYPSVPLAIMVLVAAYVWNGGTEPMSAQRFMGNFPNFVGVGIPTVQVATAGTPAGPGVHFTAQLSRNISLQPPFKVEALQLSSFELVKAGPSPDYSAACALTNASTLLDCTLTPDPGPVWANRNSLFVRVRLTSIDGFSAVALANLTSNSLGTGSIQTNISNGTGLAPGVTNGNAVYLSATLVRGMSSQSPFTTEALELASYTLAAADYSPDFSAACSFTNADTMLECTLTPDPGPFWAAGGPLVVRVGLAAVEGTSATQQTQFRIN